MPNTTLDYTKAAQEKTLEAIKQSQSVIVEAVAAWAKAAEKTVPAFPAVPDIAELPTPNEIVKTSFDFYGDVLAAQRKFANDLIAASAPVIKAPKTS
jgi:hypothetical protein